MQIVDDGRGSVPAQLADLGKNTVADLHRGTFGEFEFDKRQRHLRVGERLANALEEVRAVDLARADVEGEALVEAASMPVA